MMIIIFVILFSVAFYFLMKEFFEYKASNDSNMQLLQEVMITKQSNKIEKGNKEKSIDWQKLKNINPDIIGWIQINHTKINYPILKDSSHLKYLTYSYDNKYSTNGAIFTLNHNPFEDDITIVYGHNTRNGLMFSDLGKYMKQEFFKQSCNFHIDTKQQNYKATVFSCYSINVNTEENNIKSLDFKEEIAYYKNQSKYLQENIGKIEKVVKLSTCSYINNHTVPTNQRYYIVAKLEKV